MRGLASASISDGLPVSAFSIWLSRCPSTSDLAALATTSISCEVSAGSPAVPVFAALIQTGNAAAPAPRAPFAMNAAACASAAPGAHAQLASTVFVGAFFRAPRMTVDLVCSIHTAFAATSAMQETLALTSFPLRVVPTRWPLWDDAILVAASGAMRSARLGITLNATPALLQAAANAPRSTPLESLLSVALASPATVLAAARSVWETDALNYSRRLIEAAELPGSPSFTLTLSGASRVVLFAGATGLRTCAPLAATNATLGGAPCNLSAVSDDGTWAVLDTPSSTELCGTTTGDCGYAALALTSASDEDSLGAALVCPPFCPGAVSGGTVPVASGGGFSLGIGPSSARGALPTLLPSDDSGTSSEGIFYAAACAQTGLYTDPAMGACTNASDPASYACAYGSGSGCIACPGGALCPGGSRLWARVGFWVPSDSSTTVLPCAPPDPEVKCGGWNVTRGAVQCGAPYQTGSLRCGACNSGFYLPGDGSCEACPVIAGPWSRYRQVILLLCLAVAASLFVGLLLVLLVKQYGGTLEGCARLLLGLALWSVAALQTVSQAAPASAASLPPLLATIFRGVAVLQLDGVLLPPACTGAYAFESEVRRRGREGPVGPASTELTPHRRSVLWAQHWGWRWCTSEPSCVAPKRCLGCSQQGWLLRASCCCSSLQQPETRSPCSTALWLRCPLLDVPASMGVLLLPGGVAAEPAALCLSVCSHQTHTTRVGRLVLPTLQRVELQQ